MSPLPALGRGARERHALQNDARRCAAGIRPAISFNVAPALLRRPSFADRLGDRLREAALPPTGFTVEITESAAMADIEDVRRVLPRLQEVGVRIAWDDFGAGHSPTARLRTLPVQELRLDRAFLLEVPDDAQAVAVLDAVLRLSRALGTEAVAKGVDRPGQAAFLPAHGWGLGQGLQLGRPLSVEDLTPLLHDRSESVEPTGAEASVP